MKWNFVVSSLVLALGLSTQSYGFEMLDRMLGIGGCCEASCGAPACDTGCAAAADPACGCSNGNACDSGCASDPSCGAPACGACGGHKLGRGVLKGLFSHKKLGGCAEATCGVAAACDNGCAAAAADPACGCSNGCDSGNGCAAAEPSCGCAGKLGLGHHLKGGLLGRLLHHKKSGCCEATCGAAAGCDNGCAAAADPACGCSNGNGCDSGCAPASVPSAQPTPAPAAPEAAAATNDPSASMARKQVRARNASQVIRYGR